MCSLRRWSITTAVFVGMCSPAWAFEYIRYKLFDLVATADLVVAGTICTLEEPAPGTAEMDEWGFGDAGDFIVQLERTIAGSADGTSIRVRRFQNWTCAARWQPYAVGQRVLLCLRKPEFGSRYEILGAGDEGEMPLIESSVCVPYKVRGFDAKQHELGKSKVHGVLVPLDEFARAITGFRDTYTWTVGQQLLMIQSIVPKGDRSAVERFATSSTFARHLHEDAVTSHAWRGEPIQVTTVSLLPDARSITALANDFGGRARIAPGREPDRFGNQLVSRFGSSAAFLGDIDGNGFEDMAVGAPKDSYLGHFHGALWILFLGADHKVERVTEIIERTAGFPASMNEFASLGESVAPLGDLDGDGIGDVAVGASGWDSPDDQRGGVWILFLRRDGTIANARELGGQPALQEAGVGAGYGLGSSLANLGDLDRDGFPEIAIAQDPQFDLGWKLGRSVHIVSLGRSGQVRWSRRLHDRTEGFGQHTWFGDALAGIGDVDADGVNDIAISNTYDDDGGESRGAVWIVFLNKDGSTKAKQKISAWQGNFTGVLRDRSLFGYALAGPGDLDGDGKRDLLVTGGGGVWTLFLDEKGMVRRHSFLTVGEARPGMPRNVGSSIAPSSAGVKNGALGIALGGMFTGDGGMPKDSGVWFVKLSADGSVTAW